MLGSISRFVGNVLRHRALVFVMARRDFMARYAATLGGGAWAVIQPLSTVLVYWFVFSVGFRSVGPGGAPFIIYFLPGFLPWFTFSEVLARSTGAVIENANLVKKTTFPTEILPLVNLVSSFVGHGVFLLIVFAVLALNGAMPTLYALQIIPYFLIMCLLLLGLGWLLAALNVFHRDMGQAIGVILNLWFWLTPIVWPSNLIPARYQWIIHLNPVVEIVQGYRDSLIYARPLWQEPGGFAYLCGATALIFLTGAYVFRRLKPEFPDVL